MLSEVRRPLSFVLLGPKLIQQLDDRGPPRCRLLLNVTIPSDLHWMCLAVPRIQ